MNNRVIPALLCAAAIAFACGPHPQGTAQSVTTASATPKRRARTAKPAPVITSSVDAKVGDDVAFVLHVTNSGPKLLEVNFASGQTHDFSVLDASGREVWRWSSDRMFTQSLQNKQIPAGETVDYEERMPRGDLHGSYTVVATLQSSTHPVEQRTSFTLP
jgi:hypothetical protein